MSPSSRKRKREIRALEDHLNLVRALRTRRTLDLESHLNVPQEDEEQTETESVSSHASGEHRNWTRWPLLNNDVHVPEWSLADEVEEIVSRLLSADEEEVDITHAYERRKPAAMDVDFTVALEAADHDNNSDTTSISSSSRLPIPVLSSIAESTQVYLTHLLHTMTFARPAVHSVLTRRLAPLDWVSVLEMAGAYGLADMETIQYVREIMEDVNGPAQLKILDRMQIVEARHIELRVFADTHDNIEDEPPIPRRRPKTVGLDEDVEMEDTEEASDEDRPIRSREIISDSDVLSPPPQNKTYKSFGLLADPDSIPRTRASSRLARSSSRAALSDARSNGSDEDNHRGRRPATPKLSRQSSRLVSAPASRTTSRARTADLSQATSPAASTPADLSDDWESGDPLSSGWRVSAVDDDDFEAPRKARPAKRAKSMPRRQTLSRARSKSRGA